MRDSIGTYLGTYWQVMLLSLISRLKSTGRFISMFRDLMSMYDYVIILTIMVTYLTNIELLGTCILPTISFMERMPPATDG